VAVWLGWGWSAEDHDESGLYVDGPKAAKPNWYKLVGKSQAPEAPLTVPVARAILTKEGQQESVARRTSRRGLAPLRVGKGRHHA
jgi:hypothetical protein